ncbi:FAR1 domain-containing protein [Citrus sinensis]|uniref:FAR1 domain-containing protein n=1 Tax=Citrus sinensis TaxID=2711 RepID=A0ACB8MD89_CITSI|nr:FAR1 domain-containing protein [Citrus sinensis]
MDEEANNQVFEWQNVIMAFCFSSALQIAILSAETKKELSPSFCVLSFAIFLTFLFLFVSKLIAHKFAAASQALEKAAIVVAATTLVLATTIPYVANSAKLKYAAWALYAFSLLTIFVCNFIDEIVNLVKKGTCCDGSFGAEICISEEKAMAVTVVDQWIFLMILLLLLRLRHEPLGFGLRPTDKNCLSPLMIERDSLRMAQCSIEATLAMNFLEFDGWKQRPASFDGLLELEKLGFKMLTVDSDEGAGAVEGSAGRQLIIFEGDSIREPCEGMEFDSEEAAKIFYDEYARRVGFVMRVMSCRRSERDGRILARRLGCNKEGYCVSIRGKFGPVRKPRPSTREGCKAMIHVKFDKSGKWVITKFVKEHNHPLVVAPREARQTMDEKDKKIQELTVELRNKKRLCALYQEQLTTFMKVVEVHSDHLSKKVQNVINNLKEFESIEKELSRNR